MKLSSFLLFILLAFVAGCTHRQQQANAPAPPSIPEPQIEATKPSVPQQTDEAVSGPKVVPAPVIPSRIENERVLYAELGIASWYGSPYHHRRTANGEVYDMNQMTAAHRTLPLNSIVRVTNPQTRNSVIVRITDRGPFIGERMLDLSLAASKAVDVWAAGLAWVRMEVLESPAPLNSGGKWEVQIGAFNTLQAATRM